MPKFKITYGLSFRDLTAEIVEVDSYDTAVRVAYERVKENFESEAIYDAREVAEDAEEDDNA